MVSSTEERIEVVATLVQNNVVKQEFLTRIIQSHDKQMYYSVSAHNRKHERILSSRKRSIWSAQWSDRGSNSGTSRY